MGRSFTPVRSAASRLQKQPGEMVVKGRYTIKMATLTMRRHVEGMARHQQRERRRRDAHGQEADGVKGEGGHERHAARAAKRHAQEATAPRGASARLRRLQPVRERPGDEQSDHPEHQQDSVETERPVDVAPQPQMGGRPDEERVCGAAGAREVERDGEC